MRASVKFGLLLGFCLLITPLVISAPVVADHATCSTTGSNTEDDVYCQATMDWRHIFNNTEILSGVDVESTSDSSDDNLINGDFVNPVEGLDGTDSLLVPTRQEQRNLYQGIWDSRAPPNNELMVGSYTDNPRDIFYTSFTDNQYSYHWVDGEETSNNVQDNEPNYLGTSYFPDWWEITIIDGFAYADPEDEDREEPNNSIVLDGGYDSAEFATWDDGTETGGVLNPLQGSVEEFTWDFGTWNYEGEFDPTVVALNAAVPEDTKIKFELYEAVEPSTLQDAESNGNLDEYRLGVAEFDDSGGVGNNDVSQISSAIRHGDDNNLGLKEAYPASSLDDFSEVDSDNDEFNSIPGSTTSTDTFDDVMTYHARFVMEKDPVETKTTSRVKEDDNDELNGFEEGETLRLRKTPVMEIISAEDGDGNSVSVNLENNDDGTVTVQDSGFEDIEIKYRHDDVDETPAVSLGSSVKLGTPIPPYRRGSDPWKGYPSVLPSLSGQAERGELYNVTHIRDEDYALDLGHTEAMVVNFGKDYLDGSVGDGLSSTYGDYSRISSFAPRIPQDEDPSDDDQPNSTDRFYHGAVGEEDYHLLSPENVESDSVEHPQVVFHHVYTEVPRVEMSTYWQEDGYDDIDEDDWGVLASEDGAMYAMMDGATNVITYNNTNIRYRDHETEETEREYDGFTGPDGVQSSYLPDYSKDTGYDESDGDLEAPVVKMEYEIEDMVIQPEVGADYNYNVEGGGIFGGISGGFTVPFRQDLTDESFREPESFVFDYNQEVIEDGKTELASSERVEDRLEILDGFTTTPVDTDVNEEDLEFNGFYSLVNDTKVTYNIDYKLYEFDSNVCPEHYTDTKEIEYEEDGPEGPDGEPIYEEGDTKRYKAVNSYAIDSSVASEPEADSDIYSSYDNYLQTKDGYGEYYGIDDASGLKACDVPSGETNPDEEYITQGDWENIDYESYEHPDAGAVESFIEHDNGTQITYNSSDSKIQTLVNGEEVEVDDDSDDSDDDGFLGGLSGDDGSTETELQLSLDENLGPKDITKDSYQIDKFGFERADEQGPSDGDISDSFSVDTAIGQSEFKGRNRFNRDFSDGLEETRWTRAEATASVKRETIRFDQLGGSVNVTNPVDAEYGIQARYNEPKDITSTEPLRYEIKEGMDVYLDIYNYGPSQPENEEFEVKVNGTEVYSTGNLAESDADSTFGGDSYNTYNKIDQIDITEQVMGQSEINMSYNYSIPESAYGEERTEEIESDIDQRFDYVLTIDTNHPIQHISSRWGYSTFRDTRFDVTYEFRSSACVTDSSTDCYNYQSHSVPAGDLDGNRNYPVDPSNGNPVETTYPSNSMIVHPYLVPTTESLEISNPLGPGIKTRPTENLTNLLNEDKISYNDRFEDSGIEVESEGNFIVVEQANTIIEPVNEDTPASEPQIYESINFHDWFPEYKSDVEDLEDFEPMGELPEHRSLSSFPAMMLYGEDNLEDNYETLQDVDMGRNGDDVEVHEMWFEDGKVRINATAHNPDVLPFGIDANFVILDFPQTTVDDWPSHDGISDSVYEEGILFGGYFYQDFDKVTREDVEDSGLDIFSDPDGLIEQWQQEDLEGERIGGTYAAQDQSWVAEAEEVRTELEGSDRQVRLNKIDLSPLNSTYCPYNPNFEQRYCGMDKVSLADFNIEYAYRDEVRMPEHIDGFRPPRQSGMQESGFAEYGSFELETGSDTVTSWNIAGDASWETREISSETGNYKMFDATRVSVQPVNVTEELRNNYELSVVDHEFASESEVEDDSVQQYKLEVADEQGIPISFKDRISTTPVVSDVDTPFSEYDSEYLSSTDDGGKREGICIDVIQGGTEEESGNFYDNCYMTDSDGELYFTANVDDDEYDVHADKAEINVRVVGSEEKWWTYDSGKRLIESSKTTFNTDSLESDGGSSGATLAQAIIYLLIIIVIFLFVLSLILRIGTNPSNGPTTKDLLNIMFAPFVRPVVKRLGRMLIYFTILSIGVSVIVTATTDADLSYFFFIEGIARGLYETLIA